MKPFGIKATTLLGTTAMALLLSASVSASYAAQPQSAQPAAQSQSNEAAPAQTPQRPTPRNNMSAVPVNVTVSYQQLQAANDHPDNWMLYGRTYNNQRFSPLTQINTNNIKSLHPSAIIQTGITASFETSPIVVNGIMYVTTPWDHVIAYNAVTGKQLWSYTKKLAYNTLCCGPENRGVAVADGKVFIGTLDAQLVALNAYTGKVEWDTKVADPRLAFSITMAPQVYDGMVFIGVAGAEYPVRDFMAAYNANTGKQIWRFHTTAAPGEPGGNSWSGDSYKTGGGSLWGTPAIDTEQGLLIFGTGNPNPDNYGKDRIGDNAYTDSIVALHVKTGKLAWWYQETPHDLWDYDASSPVVLLNVKNAEGKVVPAAAESPKRGALFLVNRTNGHLIRKPIPFVMQSSTMWTHPPEKGSVIIYPGAQGGNEWSPMAFSPMTDFLYVQGTNQSWRYSANKPETVKGQLRLGGELTPVTPNGPLTASGRVASGTKSSSEENLAGAIPSTGDLSAIDVNTGKIMWQYHSDLPMLGGVLATGGNLVFAGEFNGDFDAFNAKTGQKLWHFNMGAGAMAPPVTYEVDGKQYIAIAAGGNAANGNPVLRKIKGLNSGDEIGIFRLAAPTTVAETSSQGPTAN